MKKFKCNCIAISSKNCKCAGKPKVKNPADMAPLGATHYMGNFFGTGSSYGYYMKNESGVWMVFSDPIYGWKASINTPDQMLNLKLIDYNT